MKEDLLPNMETHKREYILRIEENNIKINIYEKNIQQLDNQIRERENDIKSNQYQYSEQEIKAKARKLIELGRKG